MEVRVKNLTKQFGKTTAVNHIDVVWKCGQKFAVSSRNPR